MLGGRSVADATFYVGSLRRLGSLLEAKGDTRRALQNYDQALRMWSKADPGLQPQVADLRLRAERLRKIGG